MVRPDAHIIHLGDESNDVRIRIPNSKKVLGVAGRDYVEVDVPFEDIKKFVLNYLRWESINNLKTMSFQELELHFTDGFPAENSPIWNDDPPLETVVHPGRGQQLVASAETPPRSTVAPDIPPPSSGRPTGYDYSLYNDGQNP